MNWRDAWDGATVYASNDTISYNGTSYRSIADNNIGNLPDASPNSWSVMAARGDQGPKGDAGATGDMGPTGPQGAQGPAGPTGANGVDGAAGPTGPAGPQGAQGDVGAMGPTGATGPQGPRGINWTGTWQIGNSYSTGDSVLFNGASYIATASNSGQQPDSSASWSLLAASGVQGPQGATGPQGSAGATGATGAAGAQGPQGAQGDQGPAGPQGAVGATGATGAQGPQGPQGPQGATGAAGTSSPWILSSSNALFNSGFVGIGTSSPTDTLTVASAGNNAIVATNSGTNGTGVNVYQTASSGFTFAIKGQATSSGGTGVLGQAPNVGVQGTSTTGSGTGIFGANTSSTGAAMGVEGVSGSSSGIGVYGNGNAYGVEGETNAATGRAVFASNTSSTGAGYGLYAQTASDQSTAVFAKVTNTTNNTNARYGIWAESSILTNSWAGWFQGKVNVTGSLFAQSKSFRIDHPLDPANKYLNHVSVESPDMKTIYDGVITLDATGHATVILPDYFDALNKDFRYQLTCVGGFAPVFVEHKIDHNEFTIAGGTPGLEISWQVTGIRKDPWAQLHRVPVEELKSPDDVGKYLAPDAYGKPESYRIGIPVYQQAPVTVSPRSPGGNAGGKN